MTRPASVRTRSRRAGLLAACAATALIWGADAQALPTGSAVEAGTATVTPNGAKEVDVNQSSQRAFIDWTSFNLSPDEIVAFKQALGASSITFNRVSTDAGLTTIAGQITAPGAVWLFTPSGLIVGATAHINVGAFLASTGTVQPNFGNGPSGPGTFAPLSDNAVPIFGATAPIEIQSNGTSSAEIDSKAGFVVLNSQTITQNGKINAGVTGYDAVSFDLSDNSTITFNDPDGALQQQLVSVDVSAGDAANGQLTHGGETHGTWVQVAAPDEFSSDGGNFAGVINMSGVMQATGIAPAGTAQNSVMLLGADPVAGPIDGGNRSFSLNAAGGQMTADNGGFYFTGSDAAFGQVTAEGAVNIAVDNAVTLGAGAVLRADSGGAGSNALTLEAGSVVADASSVIAAGQASKAPSSDLSITTNQGMILGEVDGGDVELQANGGDIDLMGPSTASVLFNAQAPTGSVLVAANISSQGSIDIGATSTITVNAGVSLQSNLNGLPKGGITLDADDLELAPTSSLIAGPDMNTLVGDVTLSGRSTARVGQVAGADLNVFSDYGDVIVGGNVTVTGDVTMDFGSLGDGGGGYAKTVTVSDGVQVVAGRSIDITTFDDGDNNPLQDSITLGANVLIQSNATGANPQAGSLTLITTDLEMNPTSTVMAGADLAHLAGDVFLEGDDTAVVGKAAGGSVTVENIEGDVTLGGDITATGAVTVALNNFGEGGAYYADTITVSGGVHIVAGGIVDLESNTLITIGDGAVVQSTAGGTDEDIYLESFAVDAAPTSLLAAGPLTGPGTGRVTVWADGGDLNVGNVLGTDVHLETDAALDQSGGGGDCIECFAGGFGAFAVDGGSVYVEGTVKAAGRFDAISDSVDVHVDGSVTAGGVVNLSAAGGDIYVGPGAILIGDTSGAGSAMTVTAGGQVDMDATSALQNGATAAHPTGAVTVEADGGDITTGAISGTVVDLKTGDAVTVGGAIYGATSVTIDPSDVTLNASVTSGGPIDITADNSITLGDGVTVAAADHLNLTATTLSTGKGTTLQSDSDGDGVGDLTLTIQSVTGAPTLIAGKDATHPSAAVTAKATDGGLNLGGVTGDVVSLTADAGDVTLAGPSTTGSSLSITAVGGGIGISGNVTGGGSIDLTADDALTLGDDVTIATTGGLTVAASSLAGGKDDTLQSDSDGNGKGDLLLTAPSATGGVTLIAGQDATHPSAMVTADASEGGLDLGGVTGTVVSLTGEAGDVSLAGPSTIGASLTVTAIGGGISLGGNVDSAGTVDLTADDAVTLGAGVTVAAADHLNLTGSALTAGAGATLQSDSDGDGAGDLTLTAQSVTGGVTLIAGQDATHPTAAITADASAGGLDLGGVTGDVVSLTGEAGDVTLAGASTTGTSLTVRAVGGGIGLGADVTGSGAIDLTADKAITVADGAIVSAGDHLNATAATITVGAGGGFASDADKNGAGDLTLTASGDISFAPSGSAAGNGGDVSLTSTTGSLTLGAVSGDGVTLSSAKDLALGGNIKAAGDLSATSTGGQVAVQSSLSSGGDMNLTAHDALSVAANTTVSAGGFLDGQGTSITLGAKSVLQGDAGGTGSGAVVLSTGGDFDADATSQLLAGASTSKLTGLVSVDAGGDLKLGQALGRDVSVFAGGDVLLAGAVQGVNSVSIDPGDLTIDANISSGGTISLAAGTGGALTIGSGVAITSTGGEVLLTSDGDLTVGSNASVTGVSLLADTRGVLRLGSGASLVTTGQATAPTWPIADVPITGGGEGPAQVSGLVIFASGLDLQGSITAGQAGARDDVYIVASGETGPVVIGGDGSASGFDLSNTAVSHITARNLIVMAGFAQGDGANIQVQDLTLNTAQLGALALGTDSSHSIAVTGAVALTGGGKTDLHLGFALSESLTTGPVDGGGNTDGPPPNQTPATNTVLLGYIPGEIDITGSLGSAASPFQTAVLLARDDIFMGTADFIAAAKADANFDAGKSSSAYPIETGHVFLASHDLELAAEGRIIQQNTGGTLQYAGLVFDAPASGHELVSDPAAPADPTTQTGPIPLDGKTLAEGDGGWTPNYAAGPTRVDVFGLVHKSDGTSTSSVDAAEAGNLSATTIADVSHYKINTCVFATRCLTAPPPRIEVPTDEIIQAQAAADASTASSTQTPVGFAQSIQIDDTSDDDKNANGAPVTGSGNGDLWTGPPSTAH